MIKHKIKRCIKSTAIKIGITLTFPVFWVAVVIAIFIAISLMVSNYYNNLGENYLSSIFSNIFAGLITGLTLTVLSGTKTVYCSYKESQLLWLEETHRMIIEYLGEERKLWSAHNETDDTFFDMAYSVGADGSNVNARIMQSDFDKVKWFNPPKYFKKHYDYDCMKVNDTILEVRDYIIENGSCAQHRKNVIDELRKISSMMMTLNHKILTDIDSLKIKLAGAKKSII